MQAAVVLVPAACLALLVGAEPPVPGRPSQQYGVPGVAAGSPITDYGAPPSSADSGQNVSDPGPSSGYGLTSATSRRQPGLSGEGSLSSPTGFSAPQQMSYSSPQGGSAEGYPSRSNGPSRNYGAPTGPSSFGGPSQGFGQRQQPSSFGQRQPSSGTGQRQPSSTFGQRQSSGFGQRQASTSSHRQPPGFGGPSAQYGTPSGYEMQSALPSPSYSTPSSIRSPSDSSVPSMPSFDSRAPSVRPSSSSGTPSAPLSKAREPSSTVAPSAPASNDGAIPSGSSSEPSSSYGGFHSGGFGRTTSALVTGLGNLGRPRRPPASSSDGPSGSASGYGESSEPVMFSFQYEVDAPETGTQFGHQESREGDVTTGTYHVLLPDGRVQRVQYVADQNGYRPQVTYEDARGGQPSGPY